MPLLDTTRNKIGGYSHRLSSKNFLTKSSLFLYFPLILFLFYTFPVYIQLLSFVSENERENISQRQAEGIAAAKLRGVKFGRPQLELNEDFHIVLKDWEEKKSNTSPLL